MRTMLACAAVLGCGGTFDLKSDQLDAEHVVWRGVYRMESAPPPVRWFPDTDVVPAAFGDTGRTLVPIEIQVACGPGCQNPIWSTAWSHEAAHWRCWELTGDVDAAHGHCDWSLVERANRAIGAAGLD